jgi:hypothetical protein
MEDHGSTTATKARHDNLAHRQFCYCWRGLNYAWFTFGRSSKIRCVSVLDPAHMTSPAVSLLVRCEAEAFSPLVCLC